MRFYQIRITDQVTGNVLVADPVTGAFKWQPFSGTTWTYSSLNAGAFVTTLGGSNPAALQIELDIPQGPLHTPQGQAMVKIAGIPLQQVGQATQLAGMNIAVFGGMAKGLPLANPAQSGLLVSGQILQAVGDWLGIDQYLQIFIGQGGSAVSSSQTTGSPGTLPAVATNAKPANIIFQWQPGQTLQTAIATTLSTTFPQYGISGAISPNLVNTGETVTGFYATLPQFARDVYQKSMSTLAGYAPNFGATGQSAGAAPYLGVHITLQGNRFTLTDFTTPTTATQLQIQDFIGQPTWNQAFSLQATVCLRGDLDVGQTVILPPTPTLAPAQIGGIGGAGAAQVKQALTFSGTFFVRALRHVGNNRSTDAAAWVTTLDLAYQPAGSTSNGSAATSSSMTAMPSLPVIYTAQSPTGYFLPG